MRSGFQEQCQDAPHIDRQELAALSKVPEGPKHPFGFNRVGGKIWLVKPAFVPDSVTV
jgi:hypothetical protein